LTAALPVGCLAVTIAMFAIWPDFTSLGHVTALVIGLGMAAAGHGGEVTAAGTGPRSCRRTRVASAHDGCHGSADPGRRLR